MMKKLLLIFLLCGCTSVRTVSWDEVSQHNVLEDCWVVMRGQVFDVSGNEMFVDSCGDEVIMPEMNGTRHEFNGTPPDFNGTPPDFNGTPPDFNGSRPEGFDRRGPRGFIGDYIGEIE